MAIFDNPNALSDFSSVKAQTLYTGYTGKIKGKHEFKK